jgi:hypothetical protein
MNGARVAVAAGLGGLGFFCAVVIGCLTIGLAGGGHGWNSALLSGLAGLLLLPAFGVAVALRDLPAGRVLLWLVVAFMLLTDAAVARMTWGEWSYFRKVWEAGSPGVVLWAVLWFGWQVAALALLCLKGPGTAGVRRGSAAPVGGAALPRA